MVGPASILDYAAWKRILRSAPKPNDGRVWSSALKILDSEDKNHRHNLPKDLVDPDHEQGFHHIREILSMNVNSTSSAKLDEVIQPFLLVITHRALLDCISLDTYVGDLYSFISGHNGSKAIPFFQEIINKVAAKHAQKPEGLVVSIAMALREILRRTPRALFNDQLPELVRSLSTVFETAGMSDTSGDYRIVNHLVNEFQRLLDRPNDVQASDFSRPGGRRMQPFPESTYPRDLQLPGGRHNNDKADITNIKIAPTEDEIRSEKPEYLPSTEIAQPNPLHGVQRLLDTHFRLLRHDIFGEVKNSLAGLLQLLDDSPGPAKMVVPLIGNTRANHYTDVRVNYVSFDRRRSMEFTLSFSQPSYLQRKSITDRRKWWEETKRLNEGSLLCLLFFHEGRFSLTFLTVTEKTVDSGRPRNLVSGHYACIATKLEFGEGEDRFNQLMQLSFQDQKARPSLLVEFPGILPATFVPILENLQRMQRMSQLPFYEWITPDSEYGPTSDGATSWDIPLPLYAQSYGFEFDLSPVVTKGGPSLELRPGLAHTRDMARELEHRTSLDRGQCEAFVEALRREFSLIQGPPGTGKSYLGVQLMRTLLHNKRKAKLGPILVV